MGKVCPFLSVVEVTPIALASHFIDANRLRPDLDQPSPRFFGENSSTNDAVGPDFLPEAHIGKASFMTLVPDVSGTAALAIVESLLLALNDRKVLPEDEIMGILRDAAAANENMPETAERPGHHASVAALINQIILGGNSVRRH